MSNGNNIGCSGLRRPYGHWPRASLACTARGQAEAQAERINLDVFIHAPLP
jgi:hypothetical protein